MRGIDREAEVNWHRWTIAMIVMVTVARLLYLAFWCPYTLIEDEAHYWEWSRRLALSYYTKGPGVAWLIAGSTKVLGTSELGVRAGAALSSALAALGLAKLGRETAGDWKVGFFSAAFFFLVPMFQVMGLLMTIDGPYAACWAWAMLAGWRVLGSGRVWQMPLLGAALGIGVLFKYTILLAIPGLVWYAWRFRSDRSSRSSRSGIFPALLGLGAFLIGVSPIAIWNASNGWPTVAHLLGHLGVKGGDMPVTQGSGHWNYEIKWTLEYLGTQVGMIGPVLGLACMGLWMTVRPKLPVVNRERSARWFLVSGAVPILVFYLIVSFITEPEGNWPLAGYLTLLPLAAWTLVDDRQDAASAARARRWWRATWIMGAAVAVGIPGLPLLAKAPGVGARIPVHRFTGADRMARHVARLLEDLKNRTGLEPFVIAMHYGRASQLAFYLPGQPTVYCSSSLMLEGRRTQYDFWPDTDVRRITTLDGRPAVAIGASEEDWLPVFREVQEVGRLDGDGKKNRPAFLGIGYRGFGNVP